ncbi:MAG: site-2 protease family protein [Chthoniobacter sp.]
MPAEGEAGEEPKPSIGVVLNDELGFIAEQGGLRDTVHTPPFEQIVLGVKQITGMVSAIASKSNIGVQHMGGPVMMMRIYYLLFQNPDGWRLALWFSVIINVNLALLNLLPIPPLDGSHITLGIIEIIRGKPVKGKLLEYVMTPFTLLVIGFMIFVTFHDVQDLFGGKKSEMRFKARAEQKP